MTHDLVRFFHPSRHGLQLAAASALLVCAGMAQAQYMWVDAKGIKQFSDQPPPPSVPLSHILKAPKGQPSVQNTAETEAAAAAAASAEAAIGGPKQPPTRAAREADYAKRRKEKGEQDKKEREEKSNRMAQADNCERARAAKVVVDSGARLSNTDKNGERSVMDDNARAAESRRLEKIIADCKAG